MKTHRKQQPWILLSLFALALLLTPAAQAQGRIGLFAGGYQPEDDSGADADITLTYGVEGGYRFSPQLGASASLSQVDLADAFGFDEFENDFPFSPEIEIDLTMLDLSLEWYPLGGNFVVLGGPGVARLDFDIRTLGPADEPIQFSDSEDIVTAHLGVGYLWNLGDRLTLRPEARVRRFFNDESDDLESVSYESTDVEARVTLAWKIGG